MIPPSMAGVPAYAAPSDVRAALVVQCAPGRGAGRDVPVTTGQL